MEQLAKAIALASYAFRDKFDRGGKPYILHCLRVMMAVDQGDPELMQIAVLHDLLEDTDYKESDLKRMGYSERVIDALLLLTHERGETYSEYIFKMASNPDAVAVKKADLRDNSDITRLKGIQTKDLSRIEKYHRAYLYLSN